MTSKEITIFLNNKIKQNEDFIRITFYEMRIKENLSQEETEQFIQEAKNKLKNFNYKVYEIGNKYWYNGNSYVVQSNELLIAVKTQEINGYGSQNEIQ